MLYALQLFRRRLQLALKLAILGCALATVAAGLLMAASASKSASNAFGMVILCMGLATLGAVGGLVYAQQRGTDLVLAIRDNASRQPVGEDLETNGWVTTTKSAPFNSACRFHIDALESPQLNRFFRRLDRLDNSALIRTVLDVEQGSVSYYYLDENVYLVGLTIDQSKVLTVDEELREVVNEIGLLPRGWSYRPPSRHQVQ